MLCKNRAQHRKSHLFQSQHCSIFAYTLVLPCGLFFITLEFVWSILWLGKKLLSTNINPPPPHPLSAGVCCGELLRPEARMAGCEGWEPVSICYRSLKGWAVSRSQVRQFVLLTTQWTCFIGTLLEVSSNWRPEPWGSGILPSFSRRVNYIVGGAGGLNRGRGPRLWPSSMVGVCMWSVCRNPFHHHVKQLHLYTWSVSPAWKPSNSFLLRTHPAISIL